MKLAYNGQNTMVRSFKFAHHGISDNIKKMKDSNNKDDSALGGRLMVATFLKCCNLNKSSTP
jgi:hypothetical protein